MTLYWQGQNPTIRENEWHCQTTNRAMASQTEQVWQGLGANQGDNAISSELFQLDLAA